MRLLCDYCAITMRLLCDLIPYYALTMRLDPTSVSVVCVPPSGCAAPSLAAGSLCRACPPADSRWALHSLRRRASPQQLGPRQDLTLTLTLTLTQSRALRPLRLRRPRLR